MAAVYRSLFVGLSLTMFALICTSMLTCCLVSAGVLPNQRGADDRTLELQQTLRQLKKNLIDENGLSWVRNRIFDQVQKRSCAFGAGMTHHCTAALVDKTLAMRNRVRNGLSPGKKRNIAAEIDPNVYDVTKLTSVRSNQPMVGPDKCQSGTCLMPKVLDGNHRYF